MSKVNHESNTCNNLEGGEYQNPLPLQMRPIKLKIQL